MSNYADLGLLLKWVEVTRFAYIAKAAVRKETLTSFQKCFVSMFESEVMEDKSALFLVNDDIIMRVTSFCQIDGKSSNLSDDARLQFTTCVFALTEQLKTYVKTKEKMSPGIFSSHVHIPLECISQPYSRSASTVQRMYFNNSSSSSSSTSPNPPPQNPSSVSSSNEQKVAEVPTNTPQGGLGSPPHLDGD